jgi:hypothetical protein
VNNDTSRTDDLVSADTGEPSGKKMTFAQAHSLFKDFLKDNRDRNNKNAAITRKRDGEQPYSPKKLKAAGQSWRNNRPTGFMSAMLRRLHPPYKQMLDQLPLLTYADFPAKNLGTDKERDAFRKGVTDMIRGWTGWSDFLDQIIAEDIDFGYAAVSWASEFDWKAKLHRSDEAFFYVGCPQEAGDVEVWGLKQNFRVHEVMEIIELGDKAKDAGWHRENLIKKLNSAPKEFDNRASEENARQMEDLARENNYAASYSSAVKVVKTGHIFALDKTGKSVDHYIFDRDDGTPLYFMAGRYSKMSHVLQLFAAEIGDRTLHSSRGAGRVLYNTHVSIEQARNLIQDALHLSGLILIKKSGKQNAGSTETNALTVQHPFAILGDGYEPIEGVKFEVNAEAFFALDRHASAQAEILVGAFMPGQVSMDSKGARTASEINYMASIDAQIKAGSLARFADQAFAMISEMQRRACHPETVLAAKQVHEQMLKSGKMPVYDEKLFQDLAKAQAVQDFFFVDCPSYLDQDAIKMAVKLFEEGLTVVQIIMLANSSSRSTVEDAIASQSGLLEGIVARYAADPLVDTTELKRRDIASKLGADAAERLLNVDLNPLSQLKQGRGQLMELATLLTGNDVPVDPTDDDLTHLQVVSDRIAPMIANPDISPLTSSQQFLSKAAAHADQHIQSALKKGIKPPALKPFTEMVAKLQQYVQLPPLDQQASAALSSSQGAVPAADVATGGLPGVQQTTLNAASPPRPTPSGGVATTPVPLIPQPSEQPLT